MAALALRDDVAKRKFVSAIVALLLLPAVAYAQKPPMVDVGVVLPRDVITGETVSGSIVVNPNDYANPCPSRPLLRYVSLDKLPIDVLNDLVTNPAKY